ncbi:hypothetical protein M0R45_032570 [Rubus argutus]|uniref:Uncharacterized protein n=1 Tax=Rubus argutus TaxID=59490 RepID=A0AAW1WHZ4_RUBAR
MAEIGGDELRFEQWNTERERGSERRNNGCLNVSLGLQLPNGDINCKHGFWASGIAATNGGLDVRLLTEEEITCKARRHVSTRRGLDPLPKERKKELQLYKKGLVENDQARLHLRHVH